MDGPYIKNLQLGKLFYASESVGEGHSDKLCDQISDAILDACLKIDPDSKVAIETAVSENMIVLLGEISVLSEQLCFEQVVRKVCKQIGFTSEDIGIDCNECNVIQNIKQQDENIAQAVFKEKSEEDIGAGDQGVMFGYATDEWDTEFLHPYSHFVSNKICETLAELRKSGEIPWLRPDCKCQVIVEYQKLENGQIKPIRIDNILISTQHDQNVSIDEVRKVLTEKVIQKLLPPHMLEGTQIEINPAGRFEIGGPASDAGLTGRKIIADTYGGWCSHGGGAFSGKDPSKVDRSAAYYCRYVAKSLVANGLAHRIMVQVSYAIGLSDPISIIIDSYGTVKEGLTDDNLIKIVNKNFNFRPGNIIKELNLKRPIYFKTATFGHFGRSCPEFTWEVPKMNLDLSEI